MKKLINAPDNVVTDALVGFAAAHPDLVTVHFDPDYVARVDAPVHGKVAVLSGGGSGHEPMHSGLVGNGMLDAACPGAVFTSPTPDQMLAATKAINGGSGVLYLIKNYSGDIMNFEMAVELAQAEGIEVATVVINDDVAVQNSLYTAGRRGVGATVLLEKIVGAAAAAGADLPTCQRVAEKVVACARSMGVAFSSCTVPSAGKPTFVLGDDEIELGVGIHGEPGRKRMKTTSAAEVTALLATPIIDDLPFRAGDTVLAFVNGMGGTPLIELYIVYNALAALLNQRGIAISRNLVGNYVTSLDMAGCSITLLRMDDELTSLWDAPVHTAALRWGM